MTGLARALGLLSIGVLLAGCVVKAGPEYTPPALAAPEAFGPARASLGQTVAREDGWWRGFEDPVLDSLIADALADNLDVAAAAARLAQAREQARVANSARFPTLDAQVGAGLDSVLAGRGDAGRATTGSADGSAIFNWTPDLFGAQTRALEAAQAEARRRAALVADIQRLTVADVARQYVEARRAGARLALLETSLGLQNQTLDIVRSRQEAGLAADLDVNRATAEVAETRAIQGPLELSLEAARNSVAVLLGDAPGLTAPALPGEMRVPVYAGGPEPGAPRDILRRRPDLAAAEANLARATAEIGVAAGALYPSLSLPGRLTAQATDIGSGMVVEQVIGLLSATLDIPLFDAGGRRAQVRTAEALAQEALLVYRQTLLLALRDAETALVAIRSARLSQKDYREAARASDTAFQQANALYKEGLASFIDILDAQRTLISNREALVEADADLARAIIDFHSAIGTPVPAPAP
ncbi:efflux transporter outer membrane subunit [Iodidimonas sp. SYSU 1G8]|uniref:efflux transporter outer membrane subunit n=1 Tax=Iodidimonas sp. SYSU 1G8 TaxID=3133967 RepID=UPI0031FEB0BF